MKRVKIEVTATDIKKARKLGFPRSKNCPIALAVRRALKTKIVDIGSTIAMVNKEKDLFRLSKEASKFIKKFDAGKPVKAFSFTAISI